MSHTMNHIRKNPSEKVADVIIYAVLLLLFLVILLPFYNMLLISFAKYEDIVQSRIYLYPKSLDFSNYTRAFRYDYFPNAFMNSVLVTIVGTALGLLMQSTAAYCLSRPHMPFRRTFFYMIINAFTSDFGGVDPIRKHIEDNFKIEFEPINVTWGDSEEKYTTWAVSGQLPDIIGAAAYVGIARYYQWIEDEVVRPLPDNLDAFPLTKERLAYPEVSAYQVDGKNWFYPRFTYEDVANWAMDRGMMIRKDWLEKLNLKMPETEQDYIDTMEAFAKQDPDGNGQDDTVGYLPAGTWLLTSQAWVGYGFTDERWIQTDEGEARLAVAEPSTLPLMSFLRKMYRAGGIDPDFASIKNEDAVEKFALGRVGLFGRQVSPKHLQNVYNKWAQLQPDVDFFDAIAIVPGPKVKDDYTRFAERIYWSESYFSSNVDDEKMERLLQLYEWLVSKEGSYMMAYGIEGEHYKLNGDDVEILLDKDPETGNYLPLTQFAPFAAFSLLATWTGDNLQYQDPTVEPRILEMAVKERDMRKAEWKDPQVNWDLQGINVPEKEQMASIKFGESWSKFIMDETDTSDEDLYKAMVDNWNANGYQAAVEAITKVAKEKGFIND